MRGEIREQWEKVMNNLRKRQDLVPNLIETVRYFEVGNGIYKKLIEGRQNAARVNYAGAKKIEYEHDFSQMINNLMKAAEEYKEVKTDSNYLEVKRDINKTEEKIEEETEKYNELVRKYNKHRKILFLKPLSTVFGFKYINIFEVET